MQPGLVEQHVPAGRDRGLGKLQLTNVALRQENRSRDIARLAEPVQNEHPLLAQHGQPRCQRRRELGRDRVRHQPAGAVEQARLHQAGHRVDEPGPAQASRLASPMTVSVSPSAPIETPSMAPSAARMPHRIAAPSNAGPAGAAVAEQPVAVAEDDLAVRADVDEQPRPRVPVHAGGEQPGGDVAADVGPECREHERPRTRMRRHVQVGRQHLGQLPRRHDERRHAERLGVDAERDVRHRRVAGDRDLVHVGRIGPGLRAHLGSQLAQRFPGASELSLSSAPGPAWSR